MLVAPRLFSSSLAVGAFASLIAITACSSTSSAPAGSGAENGASAASGADEIGKSCEAACGSGDDRKCASDSSACTSNICIVDPTQPIEHLTYCTTDCTTAPCPSGYRCEDIKGFGNAPSRACVANPMECGDEIVQLGEVCDGASDKGECSKDCMSVSALCGDNIVQEGETCDGDTKEGYCVDCKTIRGPYLTATNVTISGEGRPGGDDLFVESKAKVDTNLPLAGDADGCGEIKIVESTSSLTRLAWTICNPTAKLTWTFVLPRVAGSWGTSGESPAEYEATATLVDRASGETLAYGGAPAVDNLSSRGESASHEVTGDLSWRYGSPGEGSMAVLKIDYVLTPPVAP